MRKTYCDSCGKETDWRGEISFTVTRGIMASGTIMFSTYAPTHKGSHVLGNIPVDICRECFAKAACTNLGVKCE